DPGSEHRRGRLTVAAPIKVCPQANPRSLCASSLVSIPYFALKSGVADVWHVLVSSNAQEKGGKDEELHLSVHMHSDAHRKHGRRNDGANADTAGQSGYASSDEFGYTATKSRAEAAGAE